MGNHKKNLTNLVYLQFEQKVEALRNLKKGHSVVAASMPRDCMCNGALTEYARNLFKESGLKMGTNNKSHYFWKIKTSTDYQNTDLIIGRR